MGDELQSHRGNIMETHPILQVPHAVSKLQQGEANHQAEENMHDWGKHG